MEAAAASAMDFHALSRRELQALCKRNGVRANMTNAAMAEALQGLTSVDGIDEIGSTLCLPTPGRSTMKSAAKAAALAGEEQQQGSPLPRGRRVSVMSPAAIRMDVEEGDDEMKRDVVKEIVKTPGVALRSTSRRARATPAPLPTPATLRRSQRTAARKASAPVEAENLVEEVLTAKRTTRRAPAKSKMMMDLDQEEEVPAAAPEEKVQQEELKAAASDLNCDDLHEEDDEVTKLLEGNNKEEEPEEGEEGTEEEQEPISFEKSAPLPPMEDSPILGVLSKADATPENDEGVDEWSPVNKMIDEINPVNEMSDEINPVNEMSDEINPVNEMSDEINPVAEDKAVPVGEEAIKEDVFTVTGDAVHSPKEILLAAAAEVETSDEDDLVEEKEGAADEMPQAELIEDETSEEDDLVEEKEGAADEMPQAELIEDETSEEDDLVEEKEGAADEMPQAELIEDETSEIDELDEDEEWSSDDDEAIDEENIEINEEGGCIAVGTGITNVKEELVQMMQETEIAEEASEDDSAEEASEDDSAVEASEDDSAEEASEDDFSVEESEDDVSEEGEDGSAEEDDFTSDLPSEFDNIVVLSDAETDSDTTPPVLKENKPVVASVSKPLNDSAFSVTKEEKVTEEAMKDTTVDTIVKSLDDFTIKEGTQQAEEEKINTVSEAEGSKVLKKGPVDYSSMSIRRLKATLRDLSAKEGNKHAEAKRLPLEEVDDNACADC
ncbi:hypothetical protein EJB05_19618 [Eragrostis curvula]|uniref:Uncharacterized protein n=1 Tax=Eragrostis curvula TaxID=38414 RepID=A0A5J9UW39_9POAL|nr:hypothetical protein EJB05_19618 [Eragrostis curvula]